MTQTMEPEPQLRPEGIGDRLAGSEPVAAKILVVDDDRRNLFAVEEMLRAPGLELVLATSGEAALRHVLQDEFALILLDVQMPGLDGYEVASMIRGRPRSSRVPILFLTAFNKDDLHVFRGYTAGAVDYVFKPIEPLVLRSKVDVFVDLYRKTEEIRRQAEEERRLLVENLRVRGEKLKAEQALRRAQERQEVILRSLPVVVTSRSPEPPFAALFVSDNVERLTGFGAERFTGEDEFGASRIHPEDVDRVFHELTKARETGSYSCEYRWRCADDHYRVFLDQGVIAPGDGGSGEIFGTMFDVTERRYLEQQLAHASKLEAVGRLTGGIAHDFNNMLSVVIGNLDLLKKTVEHDKKATRRVRFAIDGAQRCADLTNRLLAFSRRQPLQASVVDLKEIMPDLLELLRRTLGERIEIRAKADDGVWPVHVDRSQLESALVNLSVNARDAMPDGGRLTIDMRNQSAAECSAAQPGGIEGDCVAIAVADTGTGMPPDVLQRVFEPFFTTKESGKGTGLGLSMVYGFVQQSGGHIEIDSEPGEGTTIRMFLPRSQAAAAGRTAADDGALLVLGRGEPVLVVEDDANVRQVTVSTLESLGFSVKEAGSGDEAAAMLKQDAGIQVVLSDVKMPGMTGIELGRLIRQQWPAVHVLLTSGYVDDDRVDEFEFIHKPFRAADLARKLEAMLAVKAPPAERRLAATA
jgi:signal transduction histidine kinase/DNA-binding response OmpR family regulator